MKVTPSLFNAGMVRALLSDSKTNTRRPANFPPMPEHAKPFSYFNKQGNQVWGIDYGKAQEQSNIKCPSGVVGDLLYVRETCLAKEGVDYDGIHFLADNGFKKVKNTYGNDDWVKLLNYRGKKEAVVPSVHMPRWASRLTLRITDVRVERVQDITEEDAVTEGIEVFNEDGNLWYSGWFEGKDSWFTEQWKWHCNDPVQAFKELWDGIYFKSGNGWAKNPFCWVVEFEVIKQNVDELGV